MEELGSTEYVIFERINANWLRGFEGVGGSCSLPMNDWSLSHMA